MVTLASKKHEYDLMKNEGQRTIEVAIPDGPVTKWLKCWDYKADLTTVSFKTLTPPPSYNYPKMKVVTVDLMPNYNIKFYHVTLNIK